MFRQILKLRQARKAFDEGRFREALELAADPEIAEHLKAIRLRQAALDALGASAARHERDGELSRALDDARFLRERGGGVGLSRADEIEARIEERTTCVERLRARFYRARLEAERGDLLSARTILDGMDPELLDDDMKSFQTDLARRIREARGKLDEGLRLLEDEPKRAEELLEEAGKLHPRVEGLNSAWARLAGHRARTAARGNIGDPAFLAFLTDWGLFKRRHLDGVDGAEGRNDEILLEQGKKRLKTRLGADDQIAGARQLSEALESALETDRELDTTIRGVKALAAAEERIEGGDYPAAAAALELAREQLGKTRVGRALGDQLDRARREYQPVLDRADQARARGDLAAARHELLGLLELVPGHEEAGRRLEALASGERGRLELMLALHDDLAEADLARARTRLAEAEAGLRNDAEIIDLVRQIEVEALRRSARRRHAEAAPQRPTRTAGGAATQGSLMRLSIEEFGEILLIEDDTVSIGAATADDAQLRFLAPLGARHLRIERRTSFHGGVVYMLVPEKGRDLKVGGETVLEPRKLAPGDEILVGRDLRLRFALPVERSKAAVLTVLSDHDCEGCRKIALLPARGRSGGLLIGPYEAAHVATPGRDGEIEILRETPEAGGDLVAQGPGGVALDGDHPRARVILHDQATVAAGDLVLHLEVLPRRN